jgi:hypothetical protein
MEALKKLSKSLEKLEAEVKQVLARSAAEGELFQPQ